MRRRTILLFVTVVLVLASAGYLLRSWSVQRDVRAHDEHLLHRDVVILATLVDQRIEAGGAVDAALLEPFAGEDVGARYHPGHGHDVEVRGRGFVGPLGPDGGSDNLWAEAGTDDSGYVLLSEDVSAVHDAAWGSRSQTLLLLLIAATVATLVGALLAEWHARPFRRLAYAAAALGRGRFQLDLPHSGMPEVNAIAEALHASARQLQDRLAGEDEFAHRASHALRTPLTGLRLELEEATLLESLPEEASAAFARSLQRVDQLDAVTGELIAATRRRALMAQAAIPLDLLARQITQHWAGELTARHRASSAVVAGDASTTYTPGPVEQIMEFLLVDVVQCTEGAVRVIFVAAPDGHLRITVAADTAAEGRKVGTAPMLRARTVALALGGRLEGGYAAGGVEIVLPRR